MKDIIRQAVADAAEYLHLEQGYFASTLEIADPSGILGAAAAETLVAAERKRFEQLADFVANPVQGAESAAVADRLRDEDLWSLRRPVIDSVLIAGPEGEIARTGGFVERNLMVPHTDNSRQRTADAAEFLWMRAPLHYSQGFLTNCHAATLLREAGRDFCVVVAGESYSDWIERGKNLHAITGGSAHGLMQWVGSRPSRNDEIRWQSFKVPSDKAAASGRDFNKEVLLPAPKDPAWSVPVTVAYDGAEGEGRVWLSTQEEDEQMIAIEGRENAATLAGMLIDWVQPDVVVVPRAKMEALRDKVDLCSGQELTGEEMETIKALTDLL